MKKNGPCTNGKKLPLFFGPFRPLPLSHLRHFLLRQKDRQSLRPPERYRQRLCHSLQNDRNFHCDHADPESDEYVFQYEKPPFLYEKDEKKEKTSPEIVKKL